MGEIQIKHVIRGNGLLQNTPNYSKNLFSSNTTILIFQADDERTRELLDEVYRVYGQFSAWKLRNMTHDEEPWKDAYEGKMIITHQDLKQYFKT